MRTATASRARPIHWQNVSLPTPDHDIARLRSTLDAGGLVAVALDISTGGGVGDGLCAPPHGGVSELAAIR